MAKNNSLITLTGRERYAGYASSNLATARSTFPPINISSPPVSSSLATTGPSNIRYLQQMEPVAEVVIIGAGIAGLATALGLYRKGVKSVVLESSDTLRASGFALTISSNGWRALDALGVGEILRQHHVRIQGVIVRNAPFGATISQATFAAQGKSGELEIRCVRRNLVLETLANELPRGTIKFSSKVVSIEEDGNFKLLQLVDGSTLTAKVLIGCDGVNSVVAKWLGLRKPSFAGRSAARGFASFSDGHGFEPKLRLYLGEGLRAGLFPCDERSIYWFFIWIPSAHEKEVEESAEKIRQYVLNELKLGKFPEEVVEVIERSDTGHVVAAPLTYRWPFALLWGNISKGNVCVAGDALHPMTPEIGQGGGSALEDGVVLARCLSKSLLQKRDIGEKEEYERIKKGLENYAKERRWRSFELISTAYARGFIEQSTSPLMNFLSKKLSVMFNKRSLKCAEYDCGKL